MHDPLDLARRLVAAAARITAFTGAGISAESGIPTYRGAGGLWREYDPAKFADIDYFREDPSYYWRFFRDVRYRIVAEARPNAGHLALAELERRGKLEAIVTQNIDGLHQAAGSRRVYELHGNTRAIDCLDCGATYDFAAVHEQVRTELPPRCRACGGRLKPRVVFFGESLPERALKAATAVTASCDLLLVVGSTLQVHPAASLPPLAKQVGARVVIVNVGPTAMDDLADAFLEGPAGTILPQLLEAAG
ncbi:MAG: Sir2 family NAD-dependent protein deacetylase [Deltaproteobacteria bacterium]|nr:Sir2 family NAD-dependent protein deacetylase [Deltaproteobacteria bacterium]